MRSDQLPEDGPESVVADDVPGEDAGGSSEDELRGPDGADRSPDGDAERLDGTP